MKTYEFFHQDGALSCIRVDEIRALYLRPEKVDGKEPFWRLEVAFKNIEARGYGRGSSIWHDDPDKEKLLKVYHAIRNLMDSETLIGELK